MMSKIILFLPIFYLFVLLLRVEQAFTQDLGRHLLLGELILDCWCVPKTNLFSYTTPSFPFVNHHWIPEVIFYLIVQLSSLTSLLWFKIIMIITSFIPVFYLAVRKSNPKIAVIISTLFIFVFSERFDVRPEIFSFVFVSLSMYLLSAYRDKRNILYLMPLPIIQLLWVNSHIYFIVGILLFALLGIDLLLRRKLSPPFILVFIASCLVALINPNGITGALYPLQVFGNYGYSIVENQNIFFLNSFFFNPRILVFELLALVSIVSIVVLASKKEYFYAMCTIFGVVAGFMMIRNFPLFVLIALPGIAQSVYFMTKKMSDKMRMQTINICLVLLLSFIGIHTLRFVQSEYFGLRYINGAEKAADFFIDNKVSGPIFNNFDIGSYLIYRLYPQVRVFVDGRPEAYPADFFDEYKLMQTDPTFFKQQVMRYDINTVFFAHTDITPWAQAFLQSITQNPEWVPIYSDERIIILIRDIPRNKDIIDKYKLIF